MNKILKLVEITALPEPNLTFLFRIDFQLFTKRSSKKQAKDKIESSRNQFYKHVISGYDELASIFKKRYVVLDGSKSIEMLHKEVKEILKDRLDIC